MSTSPENGARPDDRIVNLLSQWLAGHVDDEDLRREVEAIGIAELGTDQAAAVEELLRDLAGGATQGRLEVTVRETLEALALG